MRRDDVFYGADWQKHAFFNADGVISLDQMVWRGEAVCSSFKMRAGMPKVAVAVDVYEPGFLLVGVRAKVAHTQVGLWMCSPKR